ncbi:hypothetical protein GCM10009825_12040 [Arthrobacter humicola]|uniref:Uncharacterized protein n=1 Tax=Arthrobacter humicola TaxID=409291 RepID=A0ABN2YSQ8_9MICC
MEPPTSAMEALTADLQALQNDFARKQPPAPADRVGAKRPNGNGEPVRLEGWNVMVLLVMLVLVAVVIVGVTLLVLWAVRRTRRNNGGGGSGPPSY